MQSQIIKISPDLAKHYLEKNTQNRNLNESAVRYFVSQLQANKWMLTHQGIAFSETGRLLDGQHRLAAIARSGKTVEMLVTFGLPEETFTVLDTGSRRSAGDVLSIEKVQNARTTAAAVRSYILLMSVPESIWHSKYSHLTTNTAIQQMYSKNPAYWDWATKLAMSSKKARICVSSQLSCLYFLAHCHMDYNKHFLNYFHNKLAEGTYLNQGHPILAYRSKIINLNFAVKRPQQTLADYIKLFNYVVCQQKLKIFKDQQCPPMPSIVHSTHSCVDSIFEA